MVALLPHPRSASGLPEPALRLGEAVERDAPVPAHVLAHRRDQQRVTHRERVLELPGERPRPFSVSARGAIERDMGDQEADHARAVGHPPGDAPSLGEVQQEEGVEAAALRIAL